MLRFVHWVRARLRRVKVESRRLSSLTPIVLPVAVPPAAEPLLLGGVGVVPESKVLLGVVPEAPVLLGVVPESPSMPQNFQDIPEKTHEYSSSNCNGDSVLGRLRRVPVILSVAIPRNFPEIPGNSGIPRNFPEIPGNSRIPRKFPEIPESPGNSAPT